MLIGLVFINSLFKTNFTVSLDYNITFILTLSIYISGFLLFFWHYKIKYIKLYFWFYPVAMGMLTLAFASKNLGLGFLVYILWHPVFTSPNLEFQKDNFSIYTEGTFMRRCCEYEITQKQSFIFETSLGKYQTDASKIIDFEKDISFSKIHNQIKMTYKNSRNKTITIFIKID